LAGSRSTPIFFKGTLSRPSFYPLRFAL
jgi:hypothetical protein